MKITESKRAAAGIGGELNGITIRRLTHFAALAAVTVGSCALGGCKVLTIDEDRAMRARRNGDFNPQSYVDAIWKAKAVPTIDAEAVPAPDLMAAIDKGLDKAGKTKGRRVGEGSAWTFVLRGDGTVAKIDTASPSGSIDVLLSNGRTVRLQTGPVVAETAIRDALPFVAFNDFSDQLSFADVGRALTAKALNGVKPVFAALRPGSRIRFLGVANVRDAADPLVVTPVSAALASAPAS